MSDLMMTLTAHDVLRALGEPNAFGGSPPFWDVAMAARPDTGAPFLDLATLSARRALSGLPAERDRMLHDMVLTISADRALQCLAWYLHWQVFVAPEHGGPWGCPPLHQRLGSRAGLFYQLLALEFAPCLARWHRQLGYPATVTAETVQQIASYESNHLRGRGEPGLYENQFSWLVAYLTMPYVRLGRFEYQLPAAYDGGVTVWRRTRDGHVLALAEDGARVADDGLLLAADAPEAAGWTAHLVEDEAQKTVSGFPIDPAGRILQQSVQLPRDEWNLCLRKGMDVLNLHIPAGGCMTWDAMTESFQRARAFFAQHHPDRRFGALAVGTWFMDPRLAEILPADSNMLRLQRASYLFPTPPGSGGLWFVFLKKINGVDPATLPRDTSLRRALADFLATGKSWHGGGMFLLPEDMTNLREGCYSERFEALAAELGVTPFDR